MNIFSSLLLAAFLVNGGVWNDTNGTMINAHGGALTKEGSTWYWFGEHKTAGKAGNRAYVGVHCYSSEDLTTWKDEGIAFSVSKEPGSPVEEGCILERPKVAKAQDGSGYVMYFHLEYKDKGYGAAATGIAKSKTITGPYELVWNGRPNAGKMPINAEEGTGCGKITSSWGARVNQWESFLSGGQMSRDMTLYTDPDTGIVYHIYASEENSCLQAAVLRPDGLGYTGEWARLTPGDWTEAPAVVKHGEWYFMIGSGCTGWAPNAARYYRAKSVMGPWERMGNPCRGGEKTERTWGGQSTGIFEVNGRAFAMFDIWRPDNAIDGRYVWLPISFNDRGEMTIDWRDEFTPNMPEPWEDQYVSEINRLPSRTGIKPRDPDKVMNLDGEWDFTLVNGEWKDSAKITVPSCWQLVGARLGRDWDPPLYLASGYPIANDPPRVMTEPKDKSWTSYRWRNPRGVYRRHVKLPESWANRRTILRLNGYSSAVYVRVNGQEIGYGEDGRLPNEWDLTKALAQSRDGFDLEIEVLKHSDGTYLEDQDFWRMSGLFRSVELISEVKEGVFDFTATAKVAGKTGVLSVRARTLAGKTPENTWSLYNNRGDELFYGRGDQEIAVPKVRLWSAKDPFLYRVEVRCGGDIYEKKIGFRTVTIEDGILKLNGERVIVHGVNRHEMSPVGGYFMTREEMRKDMARLKEFGINAVRTCHYPDDLYWYDLCDQEGILLVAEANIEAHGSGHSLKKSALSHVKSWRKSFIERNLNHVATLKDHPSIIIWSMGNESGTGENMVAAYHAVKAADTTRPAQYEGLFCPYGKQHFDVDGSDVITTMYQKPHEIESALKKGFKRPYIMCEFSHAMGNSNGNFDEYMKLIEKYPRFQGGFIWDFADQGLIGKDGKLKYGGDFGDRPNKENGHCNGIFDSFRNPHPGAYEVAYWYNGQKPIAEVAVEGPLTPAPAPEANLETILKSLKLNFWRAKTDNDGGRMDSRSRPWREATRDQVLPEGVTTNLVVKPLEKGGYAISYTLTVPENLPEIPRVGLSFEVPGSSATAVAWNGAGPWENYSDRKAGALIGAYSKTVRDLNRSGYIRPQECGHRTSTTSLTVGNVKFSAVKDTFEWNVHPWTMEALDAARHEEELPADDGVLRVMIDAAMRGVGGDDSWGAPVHAPYRLEGARTYHLVFTITDVK